MRLGLMLITGFIGLGQALAATCTLNASSNWGVAICAETAAAPQIGDTIIVPSGITLTLPNSFTNFKANITVYGILINNKANAVWNGNIIIGGGGLFIVNQLIDIGTTSGCGYYLQVLSGGRLSLRGFGGSDLVSICGVKMLQSGGGCFVCIPFTNPPQQCGNTSSPYRPYCEPFGGFTGPTGYTQSGWSSALPIKLMAFNAAQEKDYIRLDWITVTEENFDYFIIERSRNGIDFEAIGEVKGAGFNRYDINTRYSFHDFFPPLGHNYYRLKAVDREGSVEYFGAVVASMTGDMNMVVFPNPTSGAAIHYKTNFNSGEMDRVVIHNQLGEVVGDAQVAGYDNTIVFVNPLQPGTYILKYMSGDFRKSVRFVVY